MKIKNFKLTNKGLYAALIITFAILYLFVGIVSTIHAFSFFQLANSVTLALLLSLGFELGQSGVLFAILMTKNKDRFLPWILMFTLTAIQISGNVFASFRHIATSGSDDWIFWQKTVLFGVEASNPEMYQVIIAYLQGAILPLVALGMVSLIVQNVKHFSEEFEDEKIDSSPSSSPDNLKDKLKEESKIVSNLDSDYDEFGPVDLTGLEPDKFKLFPIDVDESGIGGEATPEQEKQVSDYIRNKELSDYLDEDAALLTPELEEQKQDLHEDIVEAVSELAKQKEGKTEEQIKKRGRPRKTKEDAIEPKKEEGLLSVEESVNIPRKSKRFVNPLKKKDKKIKPVKKIEDLIKPSKGEEVIKLIEDIHKNKTEEPTLIKNKGEEALLDESQTQSGQPYIDEYGVSVINGKAIPKELKKTKKNN